MRSYPKGDATLVSKYFQAHELDCRCSYPDCETTYVDDDLMAKADALRDAVGCPVVITDGNRCPRYQQDLKARGYETSSGVSQHELFKALDLTTGRHTGLELEAAARKVGFKAVGVGKTFIHADLRDDKERRWSYSY